MSRYNETEDQELKQKVNWAAQVSPGAILKGHQGTEVSPCVCPNTPHFSVHLDNSVDAALIHKLPQDGSLED